MTLYCFKVSFHCIYLHFFFNHFLHCTILFCPCNPLVFAVFFICIMRSSLCPFFPSLVCTLTPNPSHRHCRDASRCLSMCPCGYIIYTIDFDRHPADHQTQMLTSHHIKEGGGNRERKRMREKYKV